MVFQKILLELCILQVHLNSYMEVEVTLKSNADTSTLVSNNNHAKCSGL